VKSIAALHLALLTTPSFSFPIVIFRHSQETLKSGATKAKMGNLLAMTCSASGLLGFFLIPLEQTQDWKVTGCYWSEQGS